MFLMKMSAFLARRISDLDEATRKERFIFGILVISRFFADVIFRNDGFGVFGAVGSFHTKAQDYFLDLIWKKMEENLDEVCEAINTYHSDITLDNVRPYMLKSAPPNVFSFFHLAFQSIQKDCVQP